MATAPDALNSARLTFGQACDALEHFSFERIVRDECDGSTCIFASQRDGELHTIHVDALTGEIVAGQSLTSPGVCRMI